ncbi:unnamed protein product [Arctogadus glacialis]
MVIGTEAAVQVSPEPNRTVGDHLTEGQNHDTQQCLEVWVAAQVVVECSPTVTLSVRVTSLGLRSAIPMGEGTRRYRQSECRLLFS